jgi:hypothetical protein
MDTHLIRKFERIGARAQINRTQSRWGTPLRTLSIDIGFDRHGEFFDLRIPERTNFALEVVDVQPDLRHLLLLARQDGGKDKFLCGHDERHWFTCAVPGQSVSSVKTAMDALKPQAVLNSSEYQSLSRRERLRRRNAAFIRQGEWFFTPMPNLIVPDRLILRREPLSRGGGSKAHWLEEAYRTGGEPVYVSPQHPTPLTETQYTTFLAQLPRAHRWNWRCLTREPTLYARGGVSHGDHATIHLRGWHRVWMNTERDARAAKNVVFLD